MNYEPSDNRARRVFKWLSLLALAGIPAAALAAIVMDREELLGNIAFTLLAVSVLANTAILFSYGTSPQIQKAAKITWILIALLCLIFSFCIYMGGLNSPDPHRASEIILLVTMACLSFPAGMIAVMGVAIYSMQFLAADGAGYFEVFAFWFLFFASGYFQWFWFVPWLIRRLKGFWKNRRRPG